MSNPTLGNCDACRPADTSKFARRLTLAEHCGLEGFRIPLANSDYGPTTSTFNTTGVDAWVDLVAPSGLKCNFGLAMSWNYAHASYIALTGAYGVGFASYNRPPLELLTTLVSRDQSCVERVKTRWVQKGGSIANIKFEIGGELGLRGINGPRETALLDAIDANGHVGMLDDTDLISQLTLEAGVDAPMVGILNWLEAYMPLMATAFQGVQVIAPSIMGAIYNAGQAAAVGAAETGPWPIEKGSSSGVADSFENEISNQYHLLRSFGETPWWASLSAGQLEWAVEMYPGNYLSELGSLTPRRAARLMRDGITDRIKRLRAAISAARISYYNGGFGDDWPQLDDEAPVNVVEAGIARGWITGIGSGAQPRREHSEIAYGLYAAETLAACKDLQGLASFALYDLENRSASYDVRSGHQNSYGLSKSDGSPSYACLPVSNVLGGDLSTADLGAYLSWGETIDAGIPSTH